MRSRNDRRSSPASWPRCDLFAPRCPMDRASSFRVPLVPPLDLELLSISPQCRIQLDDGCLSMTDTFFEKLAYFCNTIAFLRREQPSRSCGSLICTVVSDVSLSLPESQDLAVKILCSIIPAFRCVFPKSEAVTMIGKNRRSRIGKERRTGLIVQRRHIISN